MAEESKPPNPELPSIPSQEEDTLLDDHNDIDSILIPPFVSKMQIDEARYLCRRFYVLVG